MRGERAVEKTDIDAHIGRGGGWHGSGGPTEKKNSSQECQDMFAHHGTSSVSFDVPGLTQDS
jgi:hypothetical protein